VPAALKPAPSGRRRLMQNRAGLGVDRGARIGYGEHAGISPELASTLQAPRPRFRRGRSATSGPAFSMFLWLGDHGLRLEAKLFKAFIIAWILPHLVLDQFPRSALGMINKQHIRPAASSSSNTHIASNAMASADSTGARA